MELQVPPGSDNPNETNSSFFKSPSLITNKFFAFDVSKDTSQSNKHISNEKIIDLKISESIPSGLYVVAVSGGVDSVVLLHLLSKIPNLELIVAHFDHGIRPESAEDRKFVEDLARNYGLEFEYKREELGEHASEEKARERRYLFLSQVKNSHSALAIITAHHEDDLLETACINIIRGTFRLGLYSLSSKEILRPLLGWNKDQVKKYAKENGLLWSEDSTNTDTKYLRNRIRTKLAASSPLAKANLLHIIRTSEERSREMDAILNELFDSGRTSGDDVFDRGFFISLPYTVSGELLAYWLRKHRVEFSRKNIELLTVGLKTARAGTKFDVNKDLVFYISSKQISLEARRSV